MKVTYEESHMWSADVDADRLLAEFSDEWAEFMRGDEPSNDDVTDFVKECIAEQGRDFFSSSLAPWASNVISDVDADIEVRE